MTRLIIAVMHTTFSCCEITNVVQAFNSKLCVCINNCDDESRLQIQAMEERNIPLLIINPWLVHFRKGFCVGL